MRARTWCEKHSRDAVDVVRAMVGEIEALTATGDPPGEDPDLELVVQLRAPEGRRAELRAWCGPSEPGRLTLQGAIGIVDPRD